MADKVKVWFDPDADFLEVQFREAPGFMRTTVHDAVMERVDEQGNLLGFSVLGVSRFRRIIPWKLNSRSARKMAADLTSVRVPISLASQPVPLDRQTRGREHGNTELHSDFTDHFKLPFNGGAQQEIGGVVIIRLGSHEFGYRVGTSLDIPWIGFRITWHRVVRGRGRCRP